MRTKKRGKINKNKREAINRGGSSSGEWRQGADQESIHEGLGL